MRGEASGRREPADEMDQPAHAGRSPRAGKDQKVLSSFPFIGDNTLTDVLLPPAVRPPGFPPFPPAHGATHHEVRRTSRRRLSCLRPVFAVPRRRRPRFPRRRVLREERPPRAGRQLRLVPRPRQTARRTAPRLQSGLPQGRRRRPRRRPRRSGQERSRSRRAPGRRPQDAAGAAVPAAAGIGRGAGDLGEDGRPVAGRRRGRRQENLHRRRAASITGRTSRFAGRTSRP